MAASIKSSQGNITLSGDFDRFSLSDKSLYYYPNTQGAVNIDLAAVQTMDTAGLAFLLKMISFYQKQSKEVTISNESPQLIALAEISNVIKLLPISVK